MTFHYPPCKCHISLKDLHHHFGDDLFCLFCGATWWEVQESGQKCEMAPEKTEEPRTHDERNLADASI